MALLRRESTADEYKRIRDLWKRHSIAEDNRDLPGLISTLAEDCVYELVPANKSWKGHAGATQFYMELLSAFPDIKFDLTDIVIGPQGVCEEADVSATQQAPWLGLEAPSAKPPAPSENVGVPPAEGRLEWKVVIWFPWDSKQRLFRGERVYTFGIELPRAVP